MNLGELDFGVGIRRFWWVIPPLIIAVVIYAVLAAVNDDEVVLRENVRRAFDAGPTPLVAIETHAGEITIVGHNRPEVLLVGERRGIGDNDDEAFEALTSMETRMFGRGDVIQVTSGMARNVEGRAEVILELRVPPGTRLRVAQGTGPIAIEGVLGDMAVTALDGDIVVELPQGHGFRLDGGGTLASDFPLDLVPDQSEGVFVTRGVEPRQELELRAMGHTVAIREDD